MEETLIHYTSCPSCHSVNIAQAVKATDHTVSHKEFEIWECADCGLRFTQNVPNAASIGQYYQSDDYISHTNTTKGLVNRLYHMVRRHTLSEKRNLIHSATRMKKGKLLDIGAGVGAFAGYMQEQGWEVTGLEPDEETRARAAEQNGVQLRPATDLYSLTPGSYDVITLWHVLEHVHDLHAYLEQLSKLLKREGRIFIAVPNYTSYDASVYRGYWAAYDVPRHLYHFSPGAIDGLLSQHGLQLITSRPMWFDSYYISMLSEKYRKGGAGLIRAVWMGSMSNIRAFIDKSRCSSLIYVIGK
jgi:SAM-dependent methyltransferase